MPAFGAAQPHEDRPRPGTTSAWRPGRTCADGDAARWEREFPRTEAELEARGLAYFTHRLSGGQRVAEPIRYEDFLPEAVGAGLDDLPWLAETLGRPVHDPFTLYRQQQDRTRERTAS